MSGSIRDAARGVSVHGAGPEALIKIKSAIGQKGRN
jgi:hypothetical protein